MLKIIRVFIGFSTLFCCQAALASSCKEYVEYSIDELKEFRDVLNDVEADPLDRRFALEKMVCANSPSIRHYAVKQGLEITDDPLVRNEVMLKALFEKNRIDVSIGETKNMSKGDKDFLAKNDGVFSVIAKYRSESDGCIGLRSNDQCDDTYGIFINGDNVQLNYKNVSGTFRLSEAGELVGTIRAQNHKNYTRLPAVIKLF